MGKTILTRQMLIWISVLLLFLFINYLGIAKKPQQYPPYLSNSASPTGIKGIYTYVSNEHGAVNRWSNKPELLTKEAKNQLLIIVEPTFIPNQNEMNAYREFMNAGNSILLFSENPLGMFDIMVNFVDAPPNEVRELQFKDTTKYSAVVRSNVRIRANQQDQILLEDELGVNALKRPYGEGELIVSISPEWLMNGEILSNDNTSLVLTILNEARQDEAIFFDEYIHGASPTVTSVYPQFFLLFILQAVFLSLLWLWYKGKRFGPILVAREEAVRFSDERIKALAAWYLRLGESSLHNSLTIQAEYVKSLMQERWGIPFNSDWLDIDSQLQRKWRSMPRADIQSFLKGLKNVLNKQKLSKQEYLLWSKKLDRLREEVEAG